MFPMGNLAMRKARAQFACNFFACAGFEVKDNNGFKTVDEGFRRVWTIKPLSLCCVAPTMNMPDLHEASKNWKTRLLLWFAGNPETVRNWKPKD